jgi:Superfamily I DNA and RNA helicases and helicase subunits
MIHLPPYISEIHELSDAVIDPKEKLHTLKQILERVCRELTRDESVQFPNLFSRLVFIAQKHNLPRQLEWRLQHFRVREKSIKSESGQQTALREYRLAEKAVLDLCTLLQGRSIDGTPFTSSWDEPAPVPNDGKSHSGLPLNTLRVHLLKRDDEKSRLLCVAESSPVQELTVKYNVSPENSAFNDSAEAFWEGAQLNLIDCTVDKEGNIIPAYIVLEPDYLIDASAIAECFQDWSISPLHYFRNKFEEKENRSYLLLGNLANFFLDELVFAENPDHVSFDDVFLRSFKQSPFEYTSCEDIRSDNDFREFMQKARNQFENIQRVVRDDFPKRAIDLHSCTLEPSFFSEKFGFQGRLDLLHTHPDDIEAKIVELKSGKLPYPQYDNGKIGLNHEVQTAVYRLMVESVFGKEARHIDAAILYSAGGAPGENLRFAALYRELEKKIVNIRNLIVADEHAIVQGDNRQVEELFEKLFQSVTTEKKTPGFYIRKIERIRTTLSQCSELEKAYFHRYIRFISRELYLQKIGDVEYESPTGLASLWNSDFSERADALDVLFNLSILHIDNSGNDMTIHFARNQTDNDIVNFREGEICIVYPRKEESDTVLNKQILKGTIVRITKETVEVRFRYKQKNHRYFDDNPLWAIEHDTLDSSYNSIYKCLFSFLNASHKKRDILLGLEPPGSNENTIPDKRNEATTAQKVEATTTSESSHTIQNRKRSYPEDIIQKAMQAQDYFLIVGPPGTGKTSIFARRLIEEYYAQPHTNILVLAYTNRAVDELCEAINSAFGCSNGECDAYIRVGTELSCSGQYRHRLLQHISEHAKSRETLRNEIQRTRIYVSTLASINGRMELFALKHFHVAIIDEASQIPEPSIIGLLSRVDKFVMIGDHNQLSTIVLQKPSISEIKESQLREIGITDCRDSLFERLLRRCTEKGWHHAYAQLTRQGRMHIDIAAFPGTYFYSETLFPAYDWQSSEWAMKYSSDNLFDRCIATERTAFFSTEKRYSPIRSNKINETEAEIIVRLMQSIQAVYVENGKTFDAGTIGIIAPYRNQIALIKHTLAQAGIPDIEKVMIDTVERFQGSQRDVILMSFCVNKAYQMDFLCNLNRDGTVDRKLNVAITRARQQLFLVGNARILRRHPMYATLLDFYKKKLIVLNDDEDDDGGNKQV